MVQSHCDTQVEGNLGPGRSELTWKKLTETNCCEWNLMTVDPQESSSEKSAMHLASQLPGRGLIDVDDAPAPARQSKI